MLADVEEIDVMRYIGDVGISALRVATKIGISDELIARTTWQTSRHAMLRHWVECR